MYKLLPYSTITDSEFNSMQGVALDMRELRLNFPYYIDLFEGKFGELDVFVNNYFGENATDSNKLEIARALLLETVKIPEQIKPETVSAKQT
jgi:hypothetical protein